MADKKKYKASYTGAGCSTVIKSDGINSEFVVQNQGDTLKLNESDAGIYIQVTYRFGDLTCIELLYGMNRDDPVFWLYDRTWGGEGHNPKATYMRDKKYPKGKQVCLGPRSLIKDDAVAQVRDSVS